MVAADTTAGPEKVGQRARTDSFLWIPPERVAELARLTTVTNHKTGMSMPWIPYPEQIQIWNDIHEHDHQYILKVRQIGSSTACGFFGGLWVATNDAAGQFVRLGIVVDTDDKAKERIRVISSQLSQLGIDHKVVGGNAKIIFPVTQSEILAMTAGGRRAGASMTFQAFIFSELPFWRQCNAAYTSLMQALVGEGWVVIESTMGIEDPTAKDLWLSPNAYHKRFFSFEEHEEYRIKDLIRQKELISVETEQWLRSEGFTDRAAMAYWVYLLQNRCGGDPVRCFREYPQTPEHSWRFSEGRWVADTPKVLEHEAMVVPLAGGAATVKLFERPQESCQYIIGVDTAAGKGEDRSAVAVLRQDNGALAASFVSDGIVMDDLVEVVRHLQLLYTTTHFHPAYGTRIRTPKAVIESNGIGQGTLQMAQAAGLDVYDLHTTKKSAYRGMLSVKRFVEAGVLKGPIEMAKECDTCRFEAERFKGTKDLLMACGFCYYWLEENPYRPDQTGQDPQRAELAKALRQFQASRFTNHRRRTQ